MIRLHNIKKLVIEKKVSSFAVLITANEIHLAPFEFDSREEQYEKIRALRDIAKAVNAHDAWLVSEAWMAMVKPKNNETIEEARARMPKNLGDLPGRIEALICQHESADDLNAYAFEIIRGESGDIIDLREVTREIPHRLMTNCWILRDPNATTATA